jgi:hypothetical protein
LRISEAVRVKTETVNPLELAMGLVETDFQADDINVINRYQLIYVIRDDRLATFVRSLGSNIKYANPPLQILSQMEHTVQELQYMADEARSRTDVVKRLAELQEESVTDRNLIKSFLEQKDINASVIRNKSHFGPTHTQQRNGYSRR